MAKTTEKKGLMQRICEFIVDKRLLFLLLFAAILVFSVFSIGWVNIENDIAEYLPEDAEAKRGLNIMAEEFTSYGTAQILIENTVYSQAHDVAELISGVEGVARVDFDSSDIHCKDNCALIDVTFSWPTESPEAENAVMAVKDVLKDTDCYIYTEIGGSITDIVVSEMSIVVVLVAIVVIAVLIFTSSTYMEIPVLLITFVVAAAVNMGTHFILGTISFISDAVAIVLQLALSVDYAIILCNRYKEEHETLPIRDAAVRALRFAMPEISASSLTTIAGLTAMTFMKFRLGFDMGISLIKSIVCSLFTVFLLMPGLLVIFGKAMDRTKHRSFVPKITFVGKYAYASRHFVPIVFLALVVGAYTIFSGTRFAHCEELIDTAKHNENQIAQKAIEEHFGQKNMLAILVPAGDYEKEAALLDELSQYDEIESVMGLATIDAIGGYRLADPVDHIDFMEIAGVDDTVSQALFAYYAAENGEHNQAAHDIDSYKVPLIKLFLFLHDKAQEGSFELEPEQSAMIDGLYSQLSFAYGQLQSKRYSRLVTYIDLPYDDQVTYDFLDEMRSVLSKYYSDAVMVGESINAAAFNDTFGEDNMTVSIVSIVLVMLILFFTFRSFGMPLLLILVIQGSIWLNFSIPKLLGSYVFFMVYLIVSAIQMGANIDYAIVISSRYTYERECGDKALAAINTMNFAFPTIITSGSMMVIAGLLIGLRISEPTIAGIGMYVGIGTIITLVLVMFALPQILLLGDGFVRATTIKIGSGREKLLRFARTSVAVLLAAAAIFACFAVPAVYRQRRSADADNNVMREAALARIDSLEELSNSLAGESSSTDAAYDFAESLITDSVGQEQLAQGEKELESGAEELGVGQSQYDTGRAQLNYAKAQYAEGEATIKEAQAQYDAGKLTLDEAKAQYAEGQAKLKEGQAQYDEGQLRLEQAKAEYADGEAKLAEAKPIYDTIMPLYGTYQELQARYDRASENGDTVSAALLLPGLIAAKAAFETSLGSYSLSSIIADYEEGQRQLEEGVRQIAEAEEQLDDAKKELDEGYAELAAAEAQIAAGEAQLADAKKELDDGYAQLEDAKDQIAAGEARLGSAKSELDEGYAQYEDGKKELEEGRRRLEENYDKLLSDMSLLDNFANDDEKLRAGIELLADTYDLPLKAGSREDYANVLSAARVAINKQADEHNRTAKFRMYVFAALLAAALFAIICVFLCFLNKRKGSMLMAVVSGVSALACLAVWFTLCGGGSRYLVLAALALLILSAAYSVMTASQVVLNEDN